ncbi:MAG: efflux RND transporter periplasmic adaptor subunit [Thiomicrorhabdus sp.]|nr:efflux RND transporter periplasmic adaptor subunit [Thiomicrorhabdus sp.]
MKRLLLNLLLCSSVVFFSSFATAGTDTHSEGNHVSEVALLESESSAVYKYVCPMHPQIIRDHEGTCPICGMDLVKQKIQASVGAPKISAGGGANGLKQGLAIRTAEVQKTTLWRYIPTFGKVVSDESKVVHIHPRASGWISDLSVHSLGDSVEKGQLLYRLYSPEIVSAQQDFLLALHNRKRLGKSADSLVASTKTRLTLLGVSRGVIKQIQRNNKPINQIPIYASQNGVVLALSVQEGMYIQPQTELMTVADLSTVWVEAEILPLQQSWVKTGLTANLTSQAFPEERWESQIEYLYPLTDARTQALKVRLPVKNEQHLLKPNMFIDVEIYGGGKKDVLAIPLEAIIDDGKTKRVVRQLESGEFDVLEITTGIQTQGIVEVLSGLEQGQKIVISGQFLIDSESQIQSNLRRLMSAGETPPPAEHNH